MDSSLESIMLVEELILWSIKDKVQSDGLVGEVHIREGLKIPPQQISRLVH